jgi:hypothetical protein
MSMIDSLQWAPMMAPVPLAVMAAGLLSALLYGRKRQWLNATLAVVAAVALGAMLADLRLPSAGPDTLALSTDAAGNAAEAALAAVPQAAAIALTGDGMREAQWRDLPARPLQWTPATADMLWLDFPRAMSLGRMFTLTVRRAQPQAGWRLQLLAENKQVLAEALAPAAPASASQLSVQWLPPVAEAMVLQARLLDAAGKVIAQGPVPLRVKDAVPLQIQGRFDAPSFDAGALDRLLSDSGAVLDWQVTLGKAISRSETARQPLAAPNALFVDAAYIEHLAPQARSALLAQTGRGVPLVILGGNAANAALWQHEFGLALHEQSKTTEKEDMRQFGAGSGALAMPPAGLNPDEQDRAPWTVLARDGKRRPWLWQRNWQQGRIVWIGVADWHRYVISAPQALGLWWQDAMDAIAVAAVEPVRWQLPDPLPVPGLRSEICLQGAAAGAAVSIDGAAPLALQARADKADARCAAWWPQKAGWSKLAASGTVSEAGWQYVYAVSDWPAWQRALRRDATAQYAARVPEREGRGATRAAGNEGAGSGRRVPAAPLAVLFACCMLALWWREQRAAASAATAAATASV